MNLINGTRSHYIIIHLSSCIPHNTTTTIAVIEANSINLILCTTICLYHDTSAIIIIILIVPSPTNSRHHPLSLSSQSQEKYAKFKHIHLERMGDQFLNHKKIHHWRIKSWKNCNVASVIDWLTVLVVISTRSVHKLTEQGSLISEKGGSSSSS